MAMVCMHSYVSGKVQGVWFRDTTKKKAIEMGLTGWVKNLSDGRVEVIACGDEHTINEFQSWLWQGSEHSKVTDVQSENIAFEPHNHFVIR